MRKRLKTIGMGSKKQQRNKYNNKKHIAIYTEKPTKGICVDGSCRGNPNGKIAFKIYRIETNEVLMTKDCLTGTNNHAEYFGLCKAVQMFPNEVIYSDSYIAINWVKQRTHRSKYPHVALEQCVKFLQKLESLPDIRKWETKLWGENPADFGYK